MLLRGVDSSVTVKETAKPASAHVQAYGQGRSVLLNGVLWKEVEKTPRPCTPSAGYWRNAHR